jgi:site-specific recombinase XerD
MLRKNRVIPPESEKPTRPIDRLLDAFRIHLLSTCGTTNGTSQTYVRLVRVFLETFRSGDVIEVEDIQPREVLEYVSARANHYRPQTVKTVVVAVRSFLRFAGVQGLCDPELVKAVPTVPAWRLANLPGNLRNDEVSSLLASFDRSTPAGLRDHAMALCLLRLGLRAGEVASLTLDDVDWRSGICVGDCIPRALPDAAGSPFVGRAATAHRLMRR